MATVAKTKFGWQAQVALRVGGKTIRKAKTFKTKREAQVWGREFEVEVSSGTNADDTLAQVFKRYARERSRDKKGERWEVIRLDQFSRQSVNGKPLGDYTIGKVTTADLVAWRDKRLREVKPASVKREMNLLKHVFVTAFEEWELVKVNPMARVKRPPSSKRRSRRVYENEIEMLSGALDLAIDPWVTEKQIVGAAFLFAIETAMRAGEILGIKNKHINGSVVHLPETKTDEERDVAMTTRAQDILEKVRGSRKGPEQHPFDINAESRDSRFRAAVKTTGIENLQFRDSRHEGITRLAKRLEILDLARMVGHKNVNQLMTYYEASGEDLADRLNSSTSKDDTA